MPQRMKKPGSIAFFYFSFHTFYYAFHLDAGGPFEHYFVFLRPLSFERITFPSTIYSAFSVPYLVVLTTRTHFDQSVDPNIFPLITRIQLYVPHSKES